MDLRPKKSFNGIDISIIRKMNALAGKNTINLGIGQLPNNVPDSIIEQGQRGFREGQTRYTSNQGMPELRELISIYHTNKTGKKISPDQIVITNGAEGALWNTLYTFLEPEDEVLIPEISFSVYDTISKLQGAKVNCYKLNSDFSIDFKSLESLLTEKTKFVIINSPTNPTGQMISESDIKRIAQLADSMGFYIISDEIYSELYFDNIVPETPLSYTDRVIVIDGISKRAAATGLRIGWSVASEELTKPMIVANQYIATCASSISQYAAIKSLDGSSCDFLESVRKDLKKKRDFVFKTLSSINGIEVEKPMGAFYIFPNISKFGKSMDIAKKILEEEDVLVIPGVAFGEKGDDYIRISFAVDYFVLKQALERLTNFFNNWSNNENK